MVAHMIPRRIGAVALVAVSLTSAAPMRAQSDEKAVMAVVGQFFDGMRARDTAAMRSAVLPTTVLERTGNNPSGMGDPIPLSNFIARVSQGTGPGGNEQIKDPKVLIDGPLAMVWTYYTFTPGGQTQVNHCGTDAFLLRKGPDGWKIFHVADTSRSEGCTPIK
jgi:ketosteroid isomerase-like protein